MNIDELIQQLEEARDEFETKGETEIRIAYQPSWPLRATISNVMVPEPEDTEPHCEEHICFISNCSECRLTREEAEANGYDPDDPENKDPNREFLWIAVSNSAPYNENPYAPKWAWGDDTERW